MDEWETWLLGALQEQRVLQQYGYRFLWQTGWKDYRTGWNGQCKQEERVQLEKRHQKNKMLRK